MNKQQSQLRREARKVKNSIYKVLEVERDEKRSAPENRRLSYPCGIDSRPRPLFTSTGS